MAQLVSPGPGEWLAGPTVLVFLHARRNRVRAVPTGTLHYFGVFTPHGIYEDRLHAQQFWLLHADRAPGEEHQGARQDRG